MNIFKRAAGVAILALGGYAGAAQAIPFTWVDEYNPNPDILLRSGQSVSFTHNITDAASGSFRPGIDSVWDADIWLYVYDDATGDLAEQARFRFDGNNSNWYEVGGTSANPSVFHFDLNNSWLGNGYLDVRITADNDRGEDFYFARSYLSVYGNRDVDGSHSVPEPGTLALLGLGLAGLGFAARRRTK